MELYLAKKKKKKLMFRHVQLARYISEPILLIYGTSRPSNSSHFLQGQNGSFFTSSGQTTSGEVKGCALSI